MFNLHTSYYANFIYLFCHLKTTNMKLDKKLIYRQVVQLQSFAFTYHQWLRCSTSKYYLFECTKLCKDKNGNMKKYISYFMSDDTLPAPDDMGIFQLDIHMLTESDIKQLVGLCNSYGIEL